MKEEKRKTKMERSSPGSLAHSLGANAVLSPPYPNLGLDDMMTLANSNRYWNMNANPPNKSGFFKECLTSSKTWIFIGLMGFFLLLFFVYLKYGKAILPAASSTSSTSSTSAPIITSSKNPSPLDSPAAGGMPPAGLSNPFGNEASALYTPWNNMYNNKLQEALRTQQQKQDAFALQQQQQQPPQHQQPQGQQGQPIQSPFLPASLQSPQPPSARIQDPSTDPDFIYRGDRDAKMEQQRISVLESKVLKLSRKMNQCLASIRRLERTLPFDFEVDGTQDLMVSDRDPREKKSRGMLTAKKSVDHNNEQQETEDGNPSLPVVSSSRRRS